MGALACLFFRGQFVFGLLFVVDMDFCQALSGLCQGAENVNVCGRGFAGSVCALRG